MQSNLCVADPWNVCFDGEVEGGSGGEGAGGEGAGGTGKEPPKTFTQDEVNAFLAQERRKNDVKVKELEKKTATALENQNLSQEERKQLEANLEEIKSLSRTEKQQLLHEKKQVEETLTAKLKETEEKVSKTWSMFETSTIERSLLDAAVTNEAYSSQQLVALLRGRSKMVEKKDDKGKPVGDFSVMVELDDRDATTGEPIVTTRTPDAAVKRMKELPELYGNLFKNGVVSGLGGSSVTGGVTPGANGLLSREQVKALTPAQYDKIRKEQPELLGLRKK
jgi:hypothetical protein